MPTNFMLFSGLVMNARLTTALLSFSLLCLPLAHATAIAADERPTYGFYLHIYREGAAIMNQLRQIQKFYPGAPVYMMSDGGLNFTRACAEIGGPRCHFTWRPPAHDNWNPKPFLERFREAAEWLKTEYVVMLEPDVTLHRQAIVKPKFDAAGLADKWNSPLSPGLRAELTRLGKQASGRPDYELAWPHFGLAGGTAVRTDAALAAFKPDAINWKKLNDLDDKRVYSSDVSMAIAMAAHGFTYGPWDELTTGPHGQSMKDKDGKLLTGKTFFGGAFQHHGADEPEGKPLYGASVRLVDQALFTGPPDGNRDIFCQHCVWVSDKDCQKTSCPISQPNMGVSFLEVPFVKERSKTVVGSDHLSNKGHSKKLVLTTMIQDPGAGWGSDYGTGAVYPEWVQNFMQINVGHAKKHDHSHIVRTHVSPHNVEINGQNLLDKGFSRFSASWEKYRMLSDYLNNDEFSHVLFMDADAIFARPDQDTVSEMADIMDRRGASILFADEDWKGPDHAQARGISPGLVMVRSTPEARVLLRRLVSAGAPTRSSSRDAWAEECTQNPQRCLRAVLSGHGGSGGGESGALVQMVDEAQSHVAVLSGSRYNRRPASASASGAKLTPSSRAPLLRSESLEVDASGSIAVLGGDVDIYHFYNEQAKMNDDQLEAALRHYRS